MNDIKYTVTSIYDVPVQTFVNTINCRGVMSAGLAAESKRKYPEMFADYKNRCEQNTVEIGEPYIYAVTDDKWILNFPTKDDWKKSSKLERIESGLEYFVEHYQQWNIESIAFPQLGCRNGRLLWEHVKPIMVYYLSRIDIPVFISLNRDIN